MGNPASTSLCDGTESRGETVQVRTRIKKPFKLTLAKFQY